MCLGWQRKSRTASRYPDEDICVSESLEPQADERVPLPVPDEDPWDAFVPEDDHEPLPEPGDFWCEDDE